MKKKLLIKIIIALLASAAGIGITFTSCRSALFDASFAIDSLFLYGGSTSTDVELNNK